MLKIIFAILMIIVFGKILIFALRAAWGVGRILLTVGLLPLILIGLVIVGLIKIALPILLVIGIASLIFGRR